MSTAASGRVFISYRRQGSSGMAGRLYDRLVERLGSDQVFMDVDTIALGGDFAEVIAEAVSTCEVLLALIGPTWVSATDEDGRRRLDDPDDIVRVEIVAAMERDIRVIPILVEGAVMPRRHELPENLAGLVRRNALIMRHENFSSDASRLLEAIEPIMGPPTVAAVAPSGPAEAATPSPGAAKTEPTLPEPARTAEPMRDLRRGDQRQSSGVPSNTREASHRIHVANINTILERESQAKVIWVVSPRLFFDVYNPDFRRVISENKARNAVYRYIVPKSPQIQRSLNLYKQIFEEPDNDLSETFLILPESKFTVFLTELVVYDPGEPTMCAAAITEFSYSGPPSPDNTPEDVIIFDRDSSQEYARRFSDLWFAYKKKLP